MTGSVEDVGASLKQFGVADYAVFIFMLIVCSCVGLYFGYADHAQNKKRKLEARRGSETLDYLLGGRNVQVFPVSMSLVASFVSGITLLGTSTEIYIYGMQYAYILIGPSMMGIFMYFVVIPVFYDLQVVSMYEYLQKRFDVKMRLFGSLVSSLSCVVWLPIVIYVPALAFNQTTGIDIHIVTPIVMSVCIFYTCLGGIKAVIWTDVIQIVIMFGVMILIIIKGTMNVGGLGVVIERNWNSGRIEAPDFRIDPTIRHSFWTLCVGGSWYWIIVNTSQSYVQRFLSLKDVKSARKSAVVYAVAITILIGMCVYNGLLLYATYHDCDPLTTKLAKAKDQLVPLLVMQILQGIPGLPGLFIAGVFSAALSSLSTGLNSLSALVIEDYCKPLFNKGLSERTSGLIMRSTVLVFGVIAVAMVYVVEHLGSVLQLSMSIPATCAGTLFGVFMIGMFMPWIGKKAAFYGAIFGCSVMVYIVIRSQFDMAAGLLKYDIKVTSVEGCTYNFTIPQPPPVTLPSATELGKEFHHISYLYYMPLGALITCMASFILSFLFGFEDPNNIDPRLLAPVMRKYFNSRVTEKTMNIDDDRKAIVIEFELKQKQFK